MDDYGAIRRARRDGKSIRQIARDYNLARTTIRHVLKHPEPNPTPQTRNRSAKVLGPFQAIIDQILVDDDDAPPKQRHTAMQAFRRLRDEHGYPGCYGQVQRYLLKHQRRHQETFIPLGHLPCQRLEADFGHIYVDFPDGRRQIPFLVTTWAYSNYPFVLALPFERTEAILEGMAAAFEFFGCVPKDVWWDNPRTVATLILQGRQRRTHPRYAALASHYVFNPLFCMPARATRSPTPRGPSRLCNVASPPGVVFGEHDHDTNDPRRMPRARRAPERDPLLRSASGTFEGKKTIDIFVCGKAAMSEEESVRFCSDDCGTPCRPGSCWRAWAGRSCRSAGHSGTRGHGRIGAVPPTSSASLT